MDVEPLHRRARRRLIGMLGLGVGHGLEHAHTEDLALPRRRQPRPLPPPAAVAVLLHKRHDRYLPLWLEWSLSTQFASTVVADQANSRQIGSISLGRQVLSKNEASGL